MVGKWWDLGTTINVAVVVYSFSHVWPFVTPWTIAPPGSSVHGISQAIILDWVVISFPRGSPWPRDGTRVSCTARRILYHCATGKHTLIYSSVQLLSRVRLFVTPWITECQTSLSITISWSSLKLMSIESVMPSSHLILCHALFLLPSIPPNIRVFSNESTLHMRWPIVVGTFWVTSLKSKF